MAYIKISNVSKVYKDGVVYYTALKNINLEFNKNEFVAILGESGSGKSTLLNLILGISDITKGNIYIDNKNLKNFTKKRLRQYYQKEIGVIFQKDNMINLYNIYENIKIIKDKNILDLKIDKLLNKIGIEKKKETKINENSGGELQRAAAIRALINDPSILILDEPTGALDKENSEKLMNYLESIKTNKLILFVTHNKELANKYATRIIELKDGIIIKDERKIDKANISDEYTLTMSNNLSFIYKIIFIKNLIFKKKGRFVLALLSSVLLLFFISISNIAINVTNQYINHSFLSSLDANVIDIKSYEIKNKELKEINPSTIIIQELEKNEDYIVRKNYDKYLNDNLKNKLEFKNDKKINLSGVEIICASLFNSYYLKMGREPQNVNEVIINENLYNYLSSDKSIINKRFSFNDNQDNYLTLCGVSYSSMMNDSLIIYFDYRFIEKHLKNIVINDYQLDIKNINKVMNILKDLKTSKFYIDKEMILKDELNFSFEYNKDLENYNTFSELIKMAKIIIYIFLGLTIMICIMLLSNVIYSFNEEEKKNYALLKILGFSFYDISSISILIGSLIAFISFIINIFIIKQVNIYFTPLVNNFINNGLIVNLSLSIHQHSINLIIGFLIILLSSIFPLIKLYLIKLDQVLKGE